MKSLFTSGRPGRTLTTAVRPTIAAPSGPTSTTAASAAEKLTETANCSTLSSVGIDSQTRNSSARTSRVPYSPTPASCPGTTTMLPTRAAAAPMTTTR
ncbi:hypothetical protein [Nonomuraea dietziae]|uniref:hypothetical protein n=1 Tax=Nonomuraea dietziae TaxID=65515 RepID=UPI0031CDBAA0